MKPVTSEYEKFYMYLKMKVNVKESIDADNERLKSKGKTYRGTKTPHASCKEKKKTTPEKTQDD